MPDEHMGKTLVDRLPFDLFTNPDLDGEKVYERVYNVLTKPVAIRGGSSAHSNTLHKLPSPTAPLGAVLEILQYKKSALKDGPYLLQGDSVGDERGTKYVKANYVMMFDLDNGQPVDEVVGLLQDAGVFAVVWSTYSNNATTKYIETKALSAWLKKREGKQFAERDIREQLEAYCLFREGMDKRLVEDGALQFNPMTQMVQGKGESWVCTHPPLEKCRVLMPLEDPFLFHGIEGKMQSERVEDWKRLYNDVGRRLGLNYDKKCEDPARLMYLPRCPVDALTPDDVAGEGDNPTHDIFALDGDCLDLGEAETASDKIMEMAAHFGEFAKEKGVVEHTKTDGWEPVTPGLMEFMRECGEEFRICTWLLDVMPEEEIRRGGYEDDLIEVTCPNEPMHTGGRRDDPAGSPMFARQSEDGWGFGCQTDGCSTEWQRADGKGVDRAKVLDGFIQGWKTSPPVDDHDTLDLVPTDCMVDLVSEDWTPEWWAKQEKIRAELDEALGLDKTEIGESSERELDFDDPEIGLILAEALNGESTLNAVKQVLKAAALHSDTLVHGEVLKTIVERTRDADGKKQYGVTDLRKSLDAEIKVYRQAIKDQSNDEFAEPEETGDPRKDVAVWSTMDFTRQIRIMLGRWKFVNDADPRVFRWMGNVEPYKLALPNAGDPGHRMDKIDYTRIGPELHRAGVRFYKINTKDKTEREVGPFVDLTRHLGGDVNMREAFPALSAIVTVPVFNAHGDLMTEKGYDAGAETYLIPSMEYDDIADEDVTEDSAYAAVEYLFMNALRDFPFSDVFEGTEYEPVYNEDAGFEEYEGRKCPFPNFNRGAGSRANFLAMLLQTFVRPMIEGSTPLYHIDKSEAGTGANYLANVMSIVVTGRDAPGETLPRSDEELQKSILSYLLQGPPFIFYDNIHQKVKGAPLAAAITTPVMTGRRLGGNEMASAKVLNIWLTAGNSVEFSDEFLRRIVPIRLDAGVERPEDRKEFKIRELSAFVTENRAEHVRCCLTICAWWIKCGCPSWNAYAEKRINSFEEWSRVMGGILDCVGMGEDFLSNVEAFKEDKGEDRDSETELVGLLYDTFGVGVEFTLKEAFSYAVMGEKRPEEKSKGEQYVGNSFALPEVQFDLPGITEATKKKNLARHMKKLIKRPRTVEEGRVVEIAAVEESLTGRGRAQKYVLRATR